MLSNITSDLLQDECTAIDLALARKNDDIVAELLIFVSRTGDSAAVKKILNSVPHVIDKFNQVVF